MAAVCKFCDWDPAGWDWCYETFSLCVYEPRPQEVGTANKPESLINNNDDTNEDDDENGNNNNNNNKNKELLTL
jgi:hypothetical protein